jgi:hypothetical protein
MIESVRVLLGFSTRTQLSVCLGRGTIRLCRVLENRWAPARSGWTLFQSTLGHAVMRAPCLVSNPGMDSSASSRKASMSWKAFVAVSCWLYSTSEAVSVVHSIKSDSRSG